MVRSTLCHLSGRLIDSFRSFADTTSLLFFLPPFVLSCDYRRATIVLAILGLIYAVLAIINPVLSSNVQDADNEELAEIITSAPHI